MAEVIILRPPGKSCHGVVLKIYFTYFPKILKIYTAYR
jgi:hypothetical protein